MLYIHGGGTSPNDFWPYVFESVSKNIHNLGLVLAALISEKMDRAVVYMWIFIASIVSSHRYKKTLKQIKRKLMKREYGYIILYLYNCELTKNEMSFGSVNWLNWHSEWIISFKETTIMKQAINLLILNPVNVSYYMINIILFLNWILEINSYSSKRTYILQYDNII